MGKILDYWGYTRDLDYKDKVVYPFTLLDIGVGALFLVLYVIMVPFVPAWIAQVLFVSINFINLYVLRARRFKLAKALLTFGFITQLTFAVFVWFPRETGFDFYYLLVPVAVFFIYRFDVMHERLFAIGISLVSAVLYFASQQRLVTFYLFDLSSEIMGLFHAITILTTFFPIIFVFIVYSREQAMMQHELKWLANTDSLTRIMNRRALYHQGMEEFQLSVKYHYEFTLILLDLDHFKRVNDAFGHPVGDVLLVQLTELITKNTRKTDLFSRYGGEEFALLLRHTTKEEGLRTANLLMERIRAHVFTFAEGYQTQITVSMGLVQYDPSLSSFDEMIKVADRVLYLAKEKGRDQLVVYE